MITTAKRTKNITKARREEAKLATSNGQAIAAKRAKSEPQAPKTLKKGSGALIGVAQGAMDGQPHTKRAVEEARKRAQQTHNDVAAILAKLDAEEKATPKMVSGVAFATVKAAATKRASVRKSLEFSAAQAEKAVVTAAKPKAEKPAKAKVDRAPKPSANRTYVKGKTVNEAKPGSWRHYMLSTIMGATSTDAAKAAHAKHKGDHAGKALDFNWSAKEGYIVWK